MSREAPDWAQVGVEMILVNHGWGRRKTYGNAPVKIAARFKNGNVRMDGLDGQWRCRHDGVLYKVGTDYNSRTSYHLYTPELRAEIEREDAVVAAINKVRKEADRLENVWRNGGDDEILAAAAAIQEPTP